MKRHLKKSAPIKKPVRKKSSGKPRIQAIDLFCGAGGLTLGLKRAGFDVIAAIELNETATETYRHNHPEVALIEKDIRKIDAEKLRRQLGLNKGELGLLAGCPPCQGFSTLRTKKQAKSVKDERNNLLFEYLRFVEAFSPKALMMENVPALIGDARMKKFLKKLGSLGYSVRDNSIRIEDAAFYGVPQRRHRMILRIVKGDKKLRNARRSPMRTVRQALADCELLPIGQSKDPLHDQIPKHSDRVMAVIRAIPKDGGSRSALPDSLVLPCHKNHPNGFRDVYGRMKWDDVAPTLTGGCVNPSKGRFLHPSENRAITLREAAILQTFPKSYWFSKKSGRDGIALMIGNALPPEFIRRHAITIATAIRNT